MHKRKLLFLLSFGALAFTVSSVIASKNASFDYLNVKDSDFIVLFKDGKSIQDFKNEINSITSEYAIVKSYDGIANGAMISANNSLENVLKSLPSVSFVSENKGYTLKENAVYDSTVTFEEPLENNSVETMHVPENSKAGEGTVIAVLDSSFSVEHSAFANLEKDVEKKLTQNKVNEVINSENFHGKSGKFYSDKVPYVYDYGGSVTISSDGNSYTYKGDDNVESPASLHGMHVSSIATANGAFTGVAPNAQLLFMKVFGDVVGGGSGQLCTDDMIIEALEDAAAFDVDVVNMSLGSDLNDFTTGSAAYQVIEKLEKKGITVAVAAGNEGKGTWSNSGVYAFNTTDFVENGVLGNYATSDFATSVVSANVFDDSTLTSEIAVGDHTIYGSDQLVNYVGMEEGSEYEEEHPFWKLIPEGKTSVALEYVLIPGYGSINNKDTETGEQYGDDFANIDVKGKVAVIKRGGISFYQKVQNAKSKGAIGVIITNDTGKGSIGRLDLSDLAVSNYIPVYLGTKEDYDALENAENKVLTITKSQMSTFSSDGASADLGLHTEIATPGQNIAGAINTPIDADDSNKEILHDAFGYLSGTSMATPNYAGAVSLILGEQDFASEDEELKFKDTLESRVMTNATPLIQANGSPISPRKQGAGLINVENVLKSNLYLEHDGEGKVELHNEENIKTGKVDFDVTIHNESAKKGTYKTTLYVTVPELTTMDSETYPEFKGIEFQTTNNQILEKVTLPDVVLGGEEIQTISVSYELTSQDKAYLDEKFENGTYVEGFVVLEPTETTSTALSIPYMGFYGDYFKQDAVEPFTFEREEGKIYQSDLLNNLLEVTGAKLPEANFNSLIGVTTGGLEGIDMEEILYNTVDPLTKYYPIQTKLIDGKYHLYAGAKGISDTLYIQQFVNRSVVDNDVTLTNNATGQVVLNDHMFDSLVGTDGVYNLYKSNALTSLFANQFLTAHRAYTIIPLKDKDSDSYYPDGEYTLKFEYQLANGDTDVKEYILHISEDASAPEFSSVSFVNKDELTLTFEKEMFKIQISDKDIPLISEKDGKFTYSAKLSELGLSLEDNLLVSFIDENYVPMYGVISKDGYGAIWSEELRSGDEISFRQSEYAGTVVGTQIQISRYNSSGQVQSVPSTATATIFHNYEPSSVSVFSLFGENLSKVEAVVNENTITFSLESGKLFVITGNAKKEDEEDLTPPEEPQDLTALWITIGVVGGVIVVGGSGLGIFFFLKKRH